MKKSELINLIAAEAEISKEAAAKALDVAINAIKGAVKKGDNVTLKGFGTFKSAPRAARKVRNPKTGEIINIKASNKPSFSASAGFKAEMSGPPTGGGGPGKKR